MLRRTNASAKTTQPGNSLMVSGMRCNIAYLMEYFRYHVRERSTFAVAAMHQSATIARKDTRSAAMNQ
jgi:hypothetical protein